MKKYCVLGSDNRNIKIKNMLIAEGNKVVDFKEADVIIGPIPFSRDNVKINGEMITCDDIINVAENKIIFGGSISNVIKEKMNKANVKYFDLLDIEEIAVLNCIPTAEGAIQTAMEITDFTLTSSNVLVMGYGKIGKVLSKMLNGIGANVFCEARKEKDLAMIKAMGYNGISLEDLDCHLGEFDVIFNTIPTILLNESRLKLIKPSCAIIDLSSMPGGVDFEAAKKLKINVVWAVGLPGKVAPQSAAIYLKDTIDKILNNMEE